MAISTIFSGLYNLNKSAQGTESATQAAQGFEEYFSDLPRISLSREIEIGLFGELALIAASYKKEELVRGWHPAPDSTFDFSFDGKHLEVKTSTRPTRLVWLRSSQSIINSVRDLTYLSVYAPIDDAGMNIQDLANYIRESINSSLISIFNDKLDFYNLANCNLRFDFLSTSESFRFILSNDVPVISTENPRILDIKWKCSFLSLPSNGDAAAWV